MADRHIFPRGGNPFNNYITLCLTYLINNQARLHISDENVNALLDLMILWTNNWKLYADRPNRTTTIKNMKDELRGKIEALLKLIYLDIPFSVLMDDDRMVLHLKVVSKGRKSKIKVVGYSPSMAIETSEHLRKTIRFSNPETPNSVALPEGHTIFLEKYIGEPNLQDKDIVFGKGRKVTKFLYDIIFNIGDVGKTVYFCSYFENASGDRSLVSVIISSVIN